MTYDINLRGRKHTLSGEHGLDGTQDRFVLDGKPCAADVRFLSPRVLSLLIDGRSYRVLFDPRPGVEAVVVGEHRMTYTIEDPRSLRSRKRASGNESGVLSITAPMAGLIVKLLVAVGEAVKEEQPLVVMEAMKMQNELKASRAGTVTRVAVESGAIVQAGKLLLLIE
ncbi:MAG: biotin/lipoyl-containing protein [Acidobacteriaceae bacterium]